MTFRQLEMDFTSTTPRSTPSSRLTQTEGAYQAFIPGCSDADIKEWFRWMYHADPKEIIRTGGAVLVGPITAD